MVVFADRHHEGLWNSLVLLFEKRLGYELYHPWGMDWFPDNWKIAEPYNNNRGTAQQFLESGIPSDGTEILHPTRGMSFEEFKNTPIDIIIASYYPHIELYTRLRDQYHPNAKVICQYGNEWPIHPLCKNLLASTAPMNVPPHINVCYYHQEFKIPPKPSFTYTDSIVSFVNALSQSTLFQQDWDDFEQIELRLPEFKFLSFGGGCRDGSCSQKNVIDWMYATLFGFHFKEGGDGYGHVIHQWAACGTPVIFKGHQYKGKLAEKLLEHEKTGFDYDILGLDRTVKAIKSASSEQIDVMGHEIRRRFEEYVNFNKEEQLVRVFLEKLQ